MVKNMKQFDMCWKHINILISEISNYNLFLWEKYKNFARTFRATEKTKHNIVFINVVFPALFSPYQNKKCSRDEVSKYAVTLALDLSFSNTSVQCDGSHFYWHQ